MSSFAADATMASRMHNIIHATGHGVQLAPSDVAMYNNIANTDALVYYGGKADIDVTRGDYFGLHTDVGRWDAEVGGGGGGSGDGMHALYFDEPALESVGDAEVAVRTTGFDAMQQRTPVTYYGRSNQYDVRGYTRPFAADQRSTFTGGEEGFNNVHPDIANAAMQFDTPHVHAHVPLTGKVTDTIPSAAAASFDPRVSDGGQDTREAWYAPMERAYMNERKENALHSYMSSMGALRLNG